MASTVHMQNEPAKTYTQLEVDRLEKRLRAAVSEISLLRDMVNEVRAERDTFKSQLQSGGHLEPTNQDQDLYGESDAVLEQAAALKAQLDELEAMTEKLEMENEKLRSGGPDRLVNKPLPAPSSPPSLQLIKPLGPKAEPEPGIDQGKMDAIQDGRLKIRKPQEAQGLVRRLDGNRKAGFVSNIFGKRKD